MSEQILVQAENLAHRYGNHLAVHDIDLELRKGEILGLLGPNGAGKTTTLRMLAGCLAPSQGRVLIDNQDMAEAPKRAKQSLGYMPEHPPLYHELTVDEYLGFCARLHGVDKGKRADAMASAKADSGLTDMGRRVIGNLSKGYQQRVGLAQAIIHRPPVVILDEPTVGLDPNQILEIRRLITDLGKNHSVILSSHILPEIQATCSRVVIIHNGRIAFSRSMADLEGENVPVSVVVGLRRPPAGNDLQGIGGVRAVRSLGDGRFRLECEPGTDIRDDLAARAAQRDWGLFELTRARKSLEEIFVELTSTDAQAVQNKEAA